LIHFYKRMASVSSRMARQVASKVLKQQRSELSSLATTSTSGKNRQEQHKKEDNGSERTAWAGLGLLGAGLAFSAPLLAEEVKTRKVVEEKREKKGKTQEDRIRQHATADSVFEYFANYKVISESGKKTTMMSTRNFYNAMTPGSSLSEDMMVGKSAYKQIETSEVNSKFVKNANKLPLREETLLNMINAEGLLTYTDYHFLLLLMSTPTRYLDIIFHGFDVSADGSVEAKEFVHVLARVSNVKTNAEELMKSASTSGLVRYLFGADLSGSLRKEDFVKLQADLISDVLEMEFTRYAEDTAHNISETDFCRHLLYSSSISQKKKEKMIKMVAEKFDGKSEGISFENFKTFYNVLFGGADLERAMFFLDNKNNGVNREEFREVANWVVGAEVDRHVIEVVYTLLDEDGDENLSTKEFNPVLFSWRHSRGFQNGALSVTLGNMKF